MARQKPMALISLKTKQHFSILLRDFARATCPDNAMLHFQKCENEANDFLQRASRMENENSHECSDLADWFEFMEKSGGYAGLMRNFSAIDKEKDGARIYTTHDGTEDGIPTTYAQHLPHSYYLGQTARNFLAAYEQLPAMMRHMLNASLGYQVEPITYAIRKVAHARMMDCFKERDEQFNLD